MNRQFDVRYRWTLDDFLVLVRAQTRLTRAQRISIGLFKALAVLAVVALVLSMLLGNWSTAIELTVVSFLWVLFWGVLLPWQRRKSYVDQRLGDFDTEFSANEEGFIWKSELGESKFKWSSIRRVDDFADHVLLWPNKCGGWMVPKRAFATRDEADAFAQLAKEKTVGQTL